LIEGEICCRAIANAQEHDSKSRQGCHGHEWQQCQRRAQVEQVRSEAHGLGLEVVTLDIRKPDDIGPAFDQAAGVQDCRQIIVCICEAAHSVPMLVVAK